MIAYLVDRDDLFIQNQTINKDGSYIQYDKQHANNDIANLNQGQFKQISQQENKEIQKEISINNTKQLEISQKINDQQSINQYNDKEYLIDTHTHFFIDRYSSTEEFERQRNKMRDFNGATFISIACIPEYYEQAIKEALMYDFKISVGIHPFYVSNKYIESQQNFEQSMEAAVQKMREFLDRYKDEIGETIVAIGECGIGSPQGTVVEQIPQIVVKQTHYTEVQMRIALEYNLPIIFHAHKKQQLQCVIDVLMQFPELQKLKINVHGFSGAPQQLKTLKQLVSSVYISFNKFSFSSKTSVKKACAIMGINRILIETDSPGIQYDESGPSGPYNVVSVLSMLEYFFDCERQFLRTELNNNALAFYNLNKKDFKIQ